VLTSSLVGGMSVQEFGASTASPEARALVGQKFLEVFYHELFRLGRVQTDPNFANYKIQWSFGRSDPKLVLLDFGAMKEFDDEFRADYKRLARACLADDYDAIRDYAIQIGFLREDDPEELVRMHYDLARMFTEPFIKNADYDWGASDLAERVRKFMPRFIFSFKLRPPPKDFVFLNRKIVGVYFFCSAIKARFNPRPLLESFTQ
jgi:predicted unusual protein kinase regulating ubiquinone biosynthesis (AarF/ABC1/UbiB family)